MSKPVLSWFARRSRVGLMAGVVGAAVLALGTTSSLGGFTASIQNTGDKVATGSLLMQEQVTPTGGTTTTCLSTAAGASIGTNAATCGANKFGALTNAVPGATSSSTVVVTNQGSVTANTFTLSTGACTATPTAPAGAAATNVGSYTNFCNKVDVTIENDTGTAACIFPVVATACLAPTASNTLASLASAYSTTALPLPAPLAPGASETFKVAVTIDAANATNADQAMAATLPITFTFGS